MSNIDYCCRMGKIGLETGILTLVPSCEGFECDAAMAFGTSLLWNEATIATSLADGALSYK